MKILIVYHKIYERDIRATIDEHLYSFRRYSIEKCYYLNAALGIPAYLKWIKFDLIIFHYTFFAWKWFPKAKTGFLKRCERLKEVRGYKVAIPQDEYVHSDAVCSFFREFGIKTVFTCLPETEWQKVYPREKSGLEHYVTVLTGYIDEGAVARISKYKKELREIDIGYRARKLPYWLGRHGQLKWLLAEKFSKTDRGHGLRVDISTEPGDVFLGEDWYRFLLRCRTVLGCEGGASLHDPEGSIWQRVETYMETHPSAEFDEVEQSCFPGQDGNLKLFSLSPRHFECCITRTCQVLVEGDYGGILKPGVHYIDIKKDWSNLEQVMQKIKDRFYCERLAENAFGDIVGSGLYTYRKFVDKVIAHSQSVVNKEGESFSRRELICLELIEYRERLADIPLASRHLIKSAVKYLFVLFGMDSQLEKLKTLARERV